VEGSKQLVVLDVEILGFRRQPYQGVKNFFITAGNSEVELGIPLNVLLK